MAQGLCAECRQRPVYALSNGSTAGYCYPCMLDHRRTLAAIKRMYPYAKTLKKQGGRCAICRRKPEPGEVFHYDHDHKTKRFRGLLCHQCNHGLGGFHDRVDLLEVAIVYLQDPNPIKHYLLTDTPRRRLRRTRRYANA